MWVKLVLIILLGCAFVWVLKALIKTWFNIKALWYEMKHPGSLPRSGGGIVFNKKTGKLEGTSGDVILPFDD